MKPDLDRRQQEREAQHQVLMERENRIGLIAVLGFLCAALVVWWTSRITSVGLEWIIWLLYLAAMIALVRFRVGLTERRRRCGYALDWIQRARLRLEDQFDDAAALGLKAESGEEYADPDHDYVCDLDLFGKGSVYARVHSCHTSSGRKRLAAWLAGEGPGASILDRQQAIREIRDAADLRERLELEWRALRERFYRDPHESRRLQETLSLLPDWGEIPAAQKENPRSALLRWSLPVVATSVLLLKLILNWPWLSVVPFYLLNLALLARDFKSTEALEARFDKIGRCLQYWSRVFAELESYAPRCTLLKTLQAELNGVSSTSEPHRDSTREDHPQVASNPERKASHAIQSLGRRTQRLSMRNNIAWQLSFGVLWLWDWHAVKGVKDWHRSYGPLLRSWFDAVANWEALVSLAAYAEAVRERSVFPEISPDKTNCLWEGLAHPLLPAATRVANDLQFQQLGEVLLVTGSNMSGKSTFLRAVGLAAVFAEIGLPVPAKRVCLHPIQVVTCMRVADSLQEGSSRFHAEVTRLKKCVEVAESGSLTLVLLDEILAGTNSRDRHRGTAAVLESLTRTSAVALVSTHDLALGSLQEDHPEKVRMVHFRDQVVNGEMHFDYRLREGALPESNALRILQKVGLIKHTESH